MSRRSWIALATVLAVLFGAWLLSATSLGSSGRAPAPPNPTGAQAANGSTSQPTGQPAGDQGSQQTDAETGLPWISVSELPPEAHLVLRRIDAGGPFKYDKDGSTFNNFEGLLPERRRGYYKEYTVDTPGAPDRGARRIVTGDNDRIRYWTDDHYDSFSRIRR